MNTRILLNIMMLIVALGLVAAVLLTKKLDESTHTLSALDAATVEIITILHKQRKTVLQKDTGGWKIIEPINIHANAFRISSLLKLLNTTSLARYDSNDLSLEDYGLSNPETIIQFDQQYFSFGIANPMNQLRYVLHNNVVHLIDDTVFPLISSQLGTLVSPRLLPADTQITRLILPDTELWKDNNNQWNSHSKLSSDDIVDTIQKWESAQAFAVHDYVKRETLGTIIIHTKQYKNAINFNITDVDPWLIIARPDIGLEYHFNIENYNRLLRPGVDTDMPEDLKNEMQLQDSNPAETIEVHSDEFLNVINR